jgi:hypothetical protein
VGHELLVGIEDRTFAEGHRRGAVQAPALAHEPPEGRAQEGRLHLDRRCADRVDLAARPRAPRRVGHGDVEQGHGDAAVRDAPRVRQLLAKLDRDVGLVALEAQQLEAERLGERDADQELQGGRPRPR